jgi:hypothetical protein
MKKLFASLLFLFALNPSAHANEGSWFALGGSFEHYMNGSSQNGVGATAEGGYWYLGNIAYGGYAKGSFLGQVNGIPGTKLNIYDLGVFWKAATEAGLYGKLTAGLAFVDSTSSNQSATSVSLGAAGGFLFPITQSVQFGPEVAYRHLTAVGGADQLSGTILLAFTFN